MKKLFALILASSLLVTAGHSQLLKKIGEKVKNKAEQKPDPKTESPETKKESPSSTSENTTVAKDTAIEGSNPAPANIKVYNNYDFVPGDKILFEDNFADDQDGEFPTHWELKAGQAVLNKIKGEEAFFLTDGNYARVLPRMKAQKYLSDPFTLEYDYYCEPGAYMVVIELGVYDKEGGYDRQSDLGIGNYYASFSGTTSNVSLTKEYTQELKDNMEGKWHHVAIAVKNHQLKIYVDQYRVLVVPDTKEDYNNIEFAGIGSEEHPIIFKNVRIASGGNMNMIGKKFTEAKIVTHGINFDVNKATLKPESMGTLNMIIQVMKDNPDIKFEVGGHTDSDGADASNLKLSQQRADAVKDQLIKMGIDASRLTSKGYGESKPINDNTTLEGKANNRRVEFVKI